MAQIDIYTNDPFTGVTGSITDKIAGAGPGDIVYFHNTKSDLTTPGIYEFDGRLSIKGTTSTPGIIYRGVPATYNSDGSVNDPGTVITKPGTEDDLSPHDHYAFSLQGSFRNHVTIEDLTFDGCGIAFLDGTCDDLTVENNLCRNAVPDTLSGGATGTPDWVAPIQVRRGLTNSSISNNVFQDLEITFGIWFQTNGPTEIYNNLTVSNNTFTNCIRGIKGVLQHGNPGDNYGITVNGNVGTKMSSMLIEIQGDGGTATGLTVMYNKISDFIFRDDSTFGLSIVVNGNKVVGTEVAYNEISATRTADGHSGNTVNDPNGTSIEVQIGLEVGGGTSSTDSDCRVHDNIIHGCFTSISLETSNKLHVYNNHIWNGEGGAIVNSHATSVLGEGSSPLDPSDNDEDDERSGAELIGSDLFIGGTPSGNDTDDEIEITKSGSNLLVKINDVTEYNGAPPAGLIIAYSYDGDDTFIVTDVEQPLVLEGGDGTDRLNFVGTGSTSRTYAVNTTNYTFQVLGSTTDALIDTKVEASGLGTTILRGGEGITLTTGSGTDTISVGNSDVNRNVSPVAVAIAGSTGDDPVNINTDASHSAHVVFSATQRIGTLTINTGGSAAVTSGGDKVLTVTGLSITGTGTLDLTDEDVIIDYSGGSSPAAAIRSLLISGRNGGAWTGTGITSSAAAANSATALGYRDNTGNSTIFIKYTYGGDANLDGMVDVVDLGILASNWQQDGVWAQADFDYSGHIDAADNGILASNWQAGVGGPLFVGDDPEMSFLQGIEKLGLSEDEIAVLLEMLGSGGGPRL